MKYNILFGGAAGQGIETAASLLEKVLKRYGCEVFTTRDYMSRVRGGHNFILVRFGDEKISSHSSCIDGIIAFNQETIDIHKSKLSKDGFVLCDDELKVDSENKAVKLPLGKISKEIGNAKVFGSIAVGAAIKICGFDLSNVEDIFEEFFSPEIAKLNLEAVKRGFELSESFFKVKVSPDNGRFLINGNQAIALGALAAGVKFYSAYPMTPSTSIMNYIASKMRAAEVVVEQAEDEIAAINMAIGASFAGARSMTGTSGGGFCLKVEALGLAGMMEVPLVVANIQRPGPVTGFPTRTEQADLKFVVSASHGEFPRMVIAVRTPEDAFYQTVRAFNLADKYQIPVIILGDQYHADTTRTVEPFDFTKVTVERHLADPGKYRESEYNRYALNENGISDRLIPGKTFGSLVRVDSDEHDEEGRITESADVRVKMVGKRMNKLKLLEEELIEPEFIGNDDYETLLIAWGSMHGAVLEAVETLVALDKKVAALVYGDIFPLPVKLLKEKSAKAKRIINVEQNATGQLASLIREYTGIAMDSSILKFDGRQLAAEEIVDRLTGGEV